MKDKSNTPPPQLPTTQGLGIGVRLARVKRLFLTNLLGKPDPVKEAKIQDQAFWTSILTREKESECPAKHFRKVSINLRRSGEIKEAEDICSRGVKIHPLDIPLAIEHAEIAKANKDHFARLTRWQTVIELAVDKAPLTAFLNLAECHFNSGNFTDATLILNRGLEHHPKDFSLMEKLASIHAASGASIKAIAGFRSAILAHPEKDHSSSYLQLGNILADEGLLDQSVTNLREGLDRYPESSQLEIRINELTYLQDRAKKRVDDCKKKTTLTAHLFQDNFKPFQQGTICFAIGDSSLKQYVPAMLDFAETIPLPTPLRWLPQVDVYATWGAPSHQSASILDLALRAEKPYLCLSSGFLSSLAIEGKDEPTYSVIISPGNVYFDTTQPTYLEDRLNSTEYTLTDKQKNRVKNVIESIVSQKISKFNHAPRIDLRQHFPTNGVKRLLLIDQKKEDTTLQWSLGGTSTFARMLETALGMPDHEILIKLHPEVISGRAKSQIMPLLSNSLPNKVVIIDYDINPFDLFDVVDDIFVSTSQLGFEAVMAGKNVHCFAAPFYSGWGFTTDRMIVPRRNVKRTPFEVFHLFYIEHSRYFVPEKGPADIEDLIHYFTEKKRSEPTETNSIDRGSKLREVVISAAQKPENTNPLRVLIIVHCRRSGASGRYMQNLAWSLANQNCKLMVLAEGKCPHLDDGIPWRTIRFEGTKLSPSLREEIITFAPDIVYESGVRSRAQRAALEVMLVTNARLAMQSEDDDLQAHETRHGMAAALAMSEIDKPTLNADDILRFLQNNNWRHTLNVLFDPAFDAWIEPVMRLLCYRLASLHTAIWHPFERRLAEQYKVPTMVVPPVSSRQDFERIPLNIEERTAILARYDIDSSDVVFFLGGALYPFSNEYSIFLTALNLAQQKTGKQIALVISSGAGRPKLPVDSMARESLLQCISFTNLGDISDIGYTEMLKACDVVCSPGIPDTFNKFRLPSRLVKAMAMGKPVLTGRCGFGESLENGFNAFITEGEDAENWSEVIASCLDSSLREIVGKNGRKFAEKHFDSDSVAAELKKKFDAMMHEKPRSLGSGIRHGAADQSPVDSSQTRSMVKAFSSDRYDSTMQDAINILKILTTEIGTVLHVGAGRCNELVEYCRMGAKQINLVEPIPAQADSLRKLENNQGEIRIYEMAVSEYSKNHDAFIYRNERPDWHTDEEMYLLKPTTLLELQPSFRETRKCNVNTHTLAQICSSITYSGKNDLLVLELHGLEVRTLEITPIEYLEKFDWIAVRTSEIPLFENGCTFSSIQKILVEHGYQHIPSARNFSGPRTASLFQKTESQLKLVQ